MRYSDAGVDINRMNKVKNAIGKMVRSTFSPAVLSEIGLFGALFKAPSGKNPVLVASCDSVGTKILIAREMQQFDTVGIDIVNHCVNDILTLGARPLFFLDYIAHSDLSSNQLLAIVKGLTRACQENNCALIGGETAMMPDIYPAGDFDLVGFIVGGVEFNNIVNPERLNPGDWLIGIPSNGLHTNGYSLARKVFFERHNLSVHSEIKGLKRSLGNELLRPHRSYLKVLYPLLKKIKALAHITGGGFYDNIARILPAETSCIIKKSSWRIPPIFQVLQKLGDVPEEEMYRTFNMGIGMVIFVNPDKGEEVLRKIPGARKIGRVVRGTFGVLIV